LKGSIMAVRTFARVTNRVETGAIQFGEDWPGLFLRGDDAKFLSLAIESVVAEIKPTAQNKLALMHLVEVQRMVEEEVEQSKEKPV
jgi:hypothetical protein